MRQGGDDDAAAGAAWKAVEGMSGFSLRKDEGGGGLTRVTYLVLAIVPPRPLVTQTNKTARTYHRGAVSNLGLYTAIFLKLDQIIEWIPWPRTGGRHMENICMKQSDHLVGKGGKI